MIDNLLAYGWIGLVLVAWIALCVGSFLNVVIYRLPLMLERQWRAEAQAFLADADSKEADTEARTAVESERFNLATPGSRCPSCGTPIRVWQNVPVLSWLLLRGRCASCGVHIPARYPLVELLTCVATLAVLAVFGIDWLGLAAAVFTWVLIAATFIDFDTQLLPDQLTLPLVWLGLVVNMSDGFGAGGLIDLNSAVIGAIAGYGFLWGTYWGFKLVTGKEGMGYGDFKLFAAIGAWLGWEILPGAILLAAGLGLVYAAITSVLGSRKRAQPIPFGPFLAGAGWVCLLNRDTVFALLAG